MTARVHQCPTCGRGFTGRGPCRHDDETRGFVLPAAIRYDHPRGPSFRVHYAVEGWTGITLHRIPEGAAGLTEWITADEAETLGRGLLAAAQLARRDSKPEGQ